MVVVKVFDVAMYEINDMRQDDIEEVYIFEYNT